MTRQSLALDVRATAGRLAVARNPSDLFHLQATACADARAILDAEQAAQRDFERELMRGSP